ncbi:hypothetical protein Tdes44962_MAKER09595, partial [Teratosphaeria destructans]
LGAHPPPLPPPPPPPQEPPPLAPHPHPQTLRPGLRLHDGGPGRLARRLRHAGRCLGRPRRFRRSIGVGRRSGGGGGDGAAEGEVSRSAGEGTRWWWGLRRRSLRGGAGRCF